MAAASGTPAGGSFWITTGPLLGTRDGSRVLLPAKDVIGTLRIILKQFEKTAQIRGVAGCRGLTARPLPRLTQEGRKCPAMAQANNADRRQQRRSVRARRPVAARGRAGRPAGEPRLDDHLHACSAGGTAAAFARRRRVPGPSRRHERAGAANARKAPRRAGRGAGGVSRGRQPEFLISERAAVLARFGAGDQHAAIPIDLDRLRATPGLLAHGNVV